MCKHWHLAKFITFKFTFKDVENSFFTLACYFQFVLIWDTLNPYFAHFIAGIVCKLGLFLRLHVFSLHLTTSKNKKKKKKNLKTEFNVLACKLFLNPL